MFNAFFHVCISAVFVLLGFVWAQNNGFEPQTPSEVLALLWYAVFAGVVLFLAIKIIAEIISLRTDTLSADGTSFFYENRRRLHTEQVAKLRKGRQRKR